MFAGQNEKSRGGHILCLSDMITLSKNNDKLFRVKLEKLWGCVQQKLKIINNTNQVQIIRLAIIE